MTAAGVLPALLAFAQQKRMGFQEQVTFYADESRSRPVFSFKARQGLDVRAEHGQPLGYFRKDFADKATGAPVLTSERQKTMRDRYTITVHDPRLDFRVAASMAVALDAFQSR